MNRHLPQTGQPCVLMVTPLSNRKGQILSHTELASSTDCKKNCHRWVGLQDGLLYPIWCKSIHSCFWTNEINITIIYIFFETMAVSHETMAVSQTALLSCWHVMTPNMESCKGVPLVLHKVQLTSNSSLPPNQNLAQNWTFFSKTFNSGEVRELTNLNLLNFIRAPSPKRCIVNRKHGIGKLLIRLELIPTYGIMDHMIS